MTYYLTQEDMATLNERLSKVEEEVRNLRVKAAKKERHCPSCRCD